MRVIDILLVEDNPGDVVLAQRALTAAKLVNKVHVARDGDEALQFLHRQGKYMDAPRPDLILLDINLPRVSGHEVLVDIKAHPDLRRIPVVMLTTSDDEADVRASYNRHANSYITKTPDLQQMNHIIQELEEYWFAIVRTPSS